MMRIFDYFFLTRPIVLIPSWAFLIVGYLRGIEKTGSGGGGLSMAWLLLTLVLSGVYIVNQIFDRETDRENGKLYLLAEGHVTVRSAAVEAAILIAAGLVISLIARRDHFLWLAASAILGLLYSADPVRLKGRPILDLAANAVGYGAVAFLYGFSLSARVDGEALLMTVPYMLLVGAIFLHTAVVDSEGDAAAGLRTSATLLGAKGASIVAWILLAGAFFAGLLLREPYPPVAALGGLFFFSWGLLSPGKKGSSLSYQWGSLIFVLLVVIRFPRFGALLVIVFAVTRLYYHFRFGKVYPRLDF